MLFPPILHKTTLVTFFFFLFLSPAPSIFRSNHPYEVVEVISLPIDQGNPPYLKWIGDVVPE